MEVIAFFLLYPIAYILTFIVSYIIFFIPSLIAWEIFEKYFSNYIHSLVESDSIVIYKKNKIKKLDRVYDDEGLADVNKIMIKKMSQDIENCKQQHFRELCEKGLKEAPMFFASLSPAVIGVFLFCIGCNNMDYVLAVWIFILPITLFSICAFIRLFGLNILLFLEFILRIIKMACANYAALKI